MKRFGWRRPVSKIKKKVSYSPLRAKRANQYWHIDVTQIKIDSGQVYYFQPILDNFSRKILGWRLKKANDLSSTTNFVRNISKLFFDGRDVTLVSDGGSENIKGTSVFDRCRRPIVWTRVAKKEIGNSNAMIERFFHSLKNRYLNYKTINSFAELKKHIDFFVTEHNCHVPQFCLQGLTPEESYLGLKRADKFVHLEALRERDFETRRVSNGRKVCRSCPVKKPQS